MGKNIKGKKYKIFFTQNIQTKVVVAILAGMSMLSFGDTM